MDLATQDADSAVIPSNSSLRNRLTELSSQIEDLYSQIERLEAKRKSIATALDAIVYPILSLPVDITTEIFVHYFDDLLEASKLQVPVFNLDKACHAGPLRLSHVCKEWRSIAFEMPSLWNRVQASLFPRKDFRKLIECWLPRTGSHMLFLDLTDYEEQTTLLFPLLASYSSRWRAFRCSLDIPISFPIDTIQGRIPLLRELHVWSPSEPSEGYAITAFSEAPELRKVQLYRLPLGLISLPWAQLTHLTLLGQSIACGIEVLHQTPNLEELCLDLRHRSGEVAAAPTPVILHHVRKLSLPSEFRISKFLHYLTLWFIRHQAAVIPPIGW